MGRYLYYRIFDDEVLGTYPNLSHEELNSMREQNYASWFKGYVRVVANYLLFVCTYCLVMLSIAYCSYVHFKK